MRYWILCVFSVFGFACSTKTDEQRPGAKVLNNKQVAIKGAILTFDALQQLKQETLSTEEWNNVLPVILLPDEEDKIVDDETQIPGTYLITDTAIIFTAQTDLQKHKKYVARFYGSNSGLSYIKLAQSKQNLKGIQQTEFRFQTN